MTATTATTVIDVDAIRRRAMLLRIMVGNAATITDLRRDAGRAVLEFSHVLGELDPARDARNAGSLLSYAVGRYFTPGRDSLGILLEDALKQGTRDAIARAGL